ncbi:MAG: Uma2 family endonuclease [Acidobacteriaceae bacterium]|nr:Uma2 family endonuclease [Acidobacteriaceae bacterium]
MSANPKSFLTEEEHLRQERKAEYRSEYLNGKAFTTAGGTCRHASIVSDFAGELRNRFRGSSCNVVTQDMRVRVSSGGLYAYPDILVVCGPPEFLDETEDTLLADQGKDVTRLF